MRYGRRRRYPGYGQGRGYGRGYGYGLGFTGTDPTKCARFPWRQRGWWSNPDTVAPTGSEKVFLEGQVNALTQELEDFKKRLDELPKEEPQ